MKKLFLVQELVRWVQHNLLYPHPKSKCRIPVLNVLPVQAFANVYSGRQQAMTQVICHSRETRMELPAPGSWDHINERLFCLLSAFWINEHEWMIFKIHWLAVMWYVKIGIFDAILQEKLSGKCAFKTIILSSLYPEGMHQFWFCYQGSRTRDGK